MGLPVPGDTISGQYVYFKSVNALRQLELIAVASDQPVAYDGTGSTVTTVTVDGIPLHVNGGFGATQNPTAFTFGTPGPLGMGTTIVVVSNEPVTGTLDVGGVVINPNLPLTPQQGQYAAGFLPGNRSLTPSGEATVEILSAGDLVTMRSGDVRSTKRGSRAPADDPLERRVSTVGRIDAHLEVKIVDADGRIVPRGIAGELCTRGCSVMLGYWEDAPRTVQAVNPARWIHTGDLAVIDADGFCNIVGRIKEVVIRGGENVYPREVEEFLYTHPAVADVQVFGVPDAEYGEELCAWIRLRDGVVLDVGEIEQFCRGRIAHHKIPRYIRFVEQYPVTVTGKIRKFLMREVMQRDLGLMDVAMA